MRSILKIMFGNTFLVVFLVNLVKKGHDIRIHQSEHRQANGGESAI